MTNEEKVVAMGELYVNTSKAISDTMVNSEFSEMLKVFTIEFIIRSCRKQAEVIAMTPITSIKDKKPHPPRPRS